MHDFWLGHYIQNDTVTHPTSYLEGNVGFFPNRMVGGIQELTFPMCPLHHSSKAATHRMDMHTLSNCHMHAETSDGPLLWKQEIQKLTAVTCKKQI